MATDAQRQLIRKVYRVVYKRVWSKQHYIPIAKREKTQTIVIHKEDRPDHTVKYCQCGCGEKLTDKRYTEHYQTRECFIGVFHRTYCKEPT